MLGHELGQGDQNLADIIQNISLDLKYLSFVPNISSIPYIMIKLFIFINLYCDRAVKGSAGGE